MVLFPVVWVVGQSFMPEEQILEWPVQLIPSEPTLDNFIEIFATQLARQELSLVRWIFNCVYVTTLSNAGVLLLTSMAGYSFARLRFPGKKLLFFGLGASAFGIYWRVMLSLSRPAVATLGIFTFLLIWNDFTWPLVVLNSNEMRTLPVGLVIFPGEYWSYQGIVMAGAVVSSALILLVYIIFQRQSTRAVMATGFGGR